MDKKINLSLYLYNLVGEYMEQALIDRIADKLTNNTISNMDSYAIGKLICNFVIEEIKQCVFDSKSIQNLENSEEEFMEIMYKIAAVENKDVNDLNELRNNMLPVNYEIIALKLKNNEEISEESEILMNLFTYLIINKRQTTKPNYDLISSLYKIFAITFGKVLNQWWCSYCSHQNKKIKINGKFLKPEYQCIVCRYEKNKSVINIDLLKNKSKYKNLMNIFSTQQNDSESTMECSKHNQDTAHCEPCQSVLNSMHDYKDVSYVQILSSVSKDAFIDSIWLNAVDCIRNEKEKIILIQLKMCQNKKDVDTNI